MLPSFHRFLVILAFGLTASGCALRATTDFGPGDEPARRSVGADAGPFHDLLNSDRGVKNDPAGDTSR